MNNNREEISQGLAGKGWQIIILQDTIWACPINTIILEKLFLGKVHQVEPGYSLYIKHITSYDFGKQDGNMLKKTRISNTEVNSLTTQHEMAGNGVTEEVKGHKGKTFLLPPHRSSCQLLLCWLSNKSEFGLEEVWATISQTEQYMIQTLV